jgi:hypothetical protein
MVCHCKREACIAAAAAADDDDYDGDDRKLFCTICCRKLFDYCHIKYACVPIADVDDVDSE